MNKKKKQGSLETWEFSGQDQSSDKLSHAPERTGLSEETNRGPFKGGGWCESALS